MGDVGIEEYIHNTSYALDVLTEAKNARQRLRDLAERIGDGRGVTNSSAMYLRERELEIKRPLARRIWDIKQFLTKAARQ